jgi:hypothetical protein
VGARTSALTARTVLLVGLWGALAAGCNSKSNGTGPAGGPDISGEWRSGASVYRLTTAGAKVTAVFVNVSPEGQALGFKVGDLSFEGTRKGNFIQGEQIIRYQADIPCHRESGRRVPFIGMLAADGRRIVIDWYNVSLNAQTCQDVGRTMGVTHLERR